MSDKKPIPGTDNSNISSSFNQKKYSDFTLQVNETTIYCHKLILASTCAYFDSLFSSGLKESHETMMRITDVPDVAIFVLFMQFCYNFQVVIDSNTSIPLLVLAQKYQNPKLETSCLKFIESSVTTQDVCKMFEFSSQYMLKDLTQKCKRMILADVTRVDEFENLSFPLVLEIMKDESLVVREESDIFHLLMKWIKDSEKRNEHLKEILGLISFSHIEQTELLSFYERYPFLEGESRFADLFTKSLRIQNGVKVDNVFVRKGRGFMNNNEKWAFGRSSGGFTVDNMTCTMSSRNSHSYILGNVGWNTGKHLWRVNILKCVRRQWIMVGVTTNATQETSYADTTNYGISSKSQLYTNGVDTKCDKPFGERDLVDLRLDCDSWTLEILNLMSGFKYTFKLDPGTYLPHFNMVHVGNQFSVDFPKEFGRMD
jgi:hypothetical protein